MERLLKKIEKNRAAVESTCPNVLDMARPRLSGAKARKAHAACLIKLRETVESSRHSPRASLSPFCAVAEKRPFKRRVYMHLNNCLCVYQEPLLLCEGHLALQKPVCDARPGIAAYARAYVRFRRIVDLSAEKQAIKAFDMDVFEAVLGGTYIDKSIIRFVEKLAEDPQVYGKKERSCFFSIALMAYFYMLKHDKAKAAPIQSMLRAGVRCFSKAPLGFDFHLTCDDFIDSLVLSAQRLGDYYNESRFLNTYYKTYMNKEGVSADMFAVFMERLASSTESVSREYAVGFLKNVFLYDTVIYHTIGAEQLMKIVFSFLKSRAQGKKEHHLVPIYKFFVALLGVFAGTSIFSQVHDEALQLPSAGKRTQSLRFWFEVKSDVSFDKYRRMIETTCSTYEGITCILDDISECVHAVTHTSRVEPLLEFLDLLLLVFVSVSVEFLVRMRVKLTKTISRAFVNMHNTVKSSSALGADTVEGVLRENERLWPVLSKFVLAMHRMDAAESTNVKKKRGSRASPAQSSLLSLIEKVKRFETLLAERLCEDAAKRLVRLKNRSFEIRKMDLQTHHECVT